MQLLDCVRRRPQALDQRQERDRFAVIPSPRDHDSVCPEAVDEELARRAVREGTSKAALIRAYVADRLGEGRGGPDPLDALVGRYDAESGSIDELVYGS